MKRVLLSAAASLTLVLFTHAQSKNQHFSKYSPFANRHLSNLRSATAVNVHLLPYRSNKINLGSPAKTWKNFYLSGSIYKGSARFLSSDTSGNTFLGILAGRVTTGTTNTALGENALFNNTTGSTNTATGYQALYSNIEGESNTAHGYQALYSNKGFGNDAFGRSLYNNTTGFFNAAIGYGTLFNNTEGYSNVASGAFALVQNTKGIFNTAIGVGALENNIISSFNTAIGGEAAGLSLDYSNATFLGAQTNTDSGKVNVTAIGYQAHATASNQVMVGNTSVTSIGGYANWSNFSDGRYKKNVKDDVPGLEFITQLRPLTYTIDVEGIERTKPTSVQTARTISIPGLHGKIPFNATAAKQSEKQQSPEELKAKQEKANVVYTGFIAQEVEKAAQNLNYNFSGVDAPKSKTGFYALRYGDFVVPLVKAVQELNKKMEEIDALKTQLKNQQQQIDDLKNMMDKLNNHPVTFNGNNAASNLSAAYLEQNVPNPSSGSTMIRYHLSSNTGNAKIVIADSKGRIIKSIALGNAESGQITLSKGVLAAGTYTYTLQSNGKEMDTKKIIFIK